MGKTCVAGCKDIKINYKTETLKVDGKTFRKGDYLTIDGSFGEVFEGKLNLLEPELTADFFRILKWAKKFKSMIVKTNAEEPKEINKALEFYAEGIGLCRTEHMFFEEKRLRIFR
jgi:pyruvate,orthophosphate dikinase